MLKTSGLILDVYDDFEGKTIRSFFPNMSDIPDMVKAAHALSQEERQALPDSLFALVLVDGDQTLRKFACHDAGNTALSVLYFLKNASKLPEEAQIVGAENLKTACAWYNLDVPEELEKKAGALGKAMFALQLPGAVSNTKANIKQNMAGIRNAEAQGNMVTTLDQMKGKHAEVTGTSDMPQTPPTPKKPSFPVKTAGRVLHPYVDVTNKEASGWTHTADKFINRFANAKGITPLGAATVGTAVGVPLGIHEMRKVKKMQQEKTASYRALGEKYPLDDYSQVKTASAYFSENVKFFAPEERREYCYNLVKRAAELDIALPDEQRRYGGTIYADESVLKVAHFCREQSLLDGFEKDLLKTLFEKRAEIDPEVFAEALATFDKAAGLDQYYGKTVFDPYISVLGYEKTAEENWSEVEGGELVTPQGLHRLAHHAFRTLRETFGEDMAVEFKKDPVGIYRSLPMDQKKLVAKLSTDSALSTAP